VSSPAEIPKRFLVWVDSVGGYLVCLGDEVVLGQPAAGANPDVPIMGDLSRRQAIIRREREAYTIEAVRKTKLDGKTLEGRTALWDGSLIEMGEGVKLRFRRPHPLSATARLEFVSRHRTNPSTDGVLLMAETCILGPSHTSHIVARDWQHEVVLYRQQGKMVCRTSAKIKVDAAASRSPAILRSRCRVEGEEFAFSLEPIAAGN
jgi:hypothetical protein